jgi:hypothetical protein
MARERRMQVFAGKQAEDAVDADGATEQPQTWYTRSGRTQGRQCEMRNAGLWWAFRHGRKTDYSLNGYLRESQSFH